MIKLSFLILTHNRPKLFERCLNSILQFNFPFNVEVIINNDSNDIQEVYHEDINIKYFYNYSDNLTDLYKFIFEQASGEYVYYLEDDDYLLSGFLKGCEYIDKFDLIYGKYYPEKVEDFLKIKIQNTHEKENDLFQISQILFKKQLLDFSKIPLTNNINNDWILYQSLSHKSFVFLKYYFFRQTCDGKDNISFKEYNKDERFE